MPGAPPLGQGSAQSLPPSDTLGKASSRVTCGESVLLRLVQHFFLASEVGDVEERSRLVVCML